MLRLVLHHVHEEVVDFCYSRRTCQSRVRLLVQVSLLPLLLFVLLVAPLLLELLGTGGLPEPDLLAIGQRDAAVIHKALPVP